MEGIDIPEILHNQNKFAKFDGYKSHSVSANYTFTDVDKIKTLFVTTSTGTITVTLPGADNLDRVIEIMKIDSGSGKITVDGEGAETINGTIQFTIFEKYTGIRIKSNGTNWIIVNIIGKIQQSITDNVIRSQALPVAATWYQPAGANLSLTIEPGIYIFGSNILLHGYLSSAGAAATQIQLDTDIVSPFGAGLLDTGFQTNVNDFGSKAFNANTSSIITNKIIIAATSTVRISVRYYIWSGAPTLGTLYLRNDILTGRLTAERIE